MRAKGDIRNCTFQGEILLGNTGKNVLATSYADVDGNLKTDSEKPEPNERPRQ